MFRIILPFLYLNLFSLSAFSAPLAQLTPLLPKGAQVSYILASPNQQQNIHRLMLPASTQKLLTALTAKLYLPNSYTFKTHINGVIKNTELSNTEFIFNADPNFNRRDLRNMLQQLKQQGLTAINGDILLNTSRFNGYPISNGQVWNDLGVCYAAQTSAIVINGNCVLGNLKRSIKASNNIARVYIPEYQPISLTSNVQIVSKDQQKAQFCDLEVNRNRQNSYQLFGCITAAKKPLPLSFAVSEPSLYFSDILRAELKQLQIHFTGQIRTTQQAATQTTLVSHQSPSLDTLLRIMLKESDNLIADVLFKTIGAEFYQQAGNYRNGASAMQAILSEHGIDISQAHIADGSGLSRHNLLSAQILYDVLDYIIKDDENLQIIDMLPISGKDGTLQYRRGLLTKNLKGKIQAKTGSLKGAANMVGIVATKDNQKVPFVLMINGYHSTKQKTHNQPSPLSQYLSAFFTTIVEQDSAQK